MADEDHENTSVHPADPRKERDAAVSDSNQRKPLLYALSSTSYPLISLAPPPQPGTFTNGSFFLSDNLPERDQLLPYLLDPPSEEQSVISAASSGILQYSGLWEKASPGREWLWWVAGVLGALILCGMTIPRLSKRQSLPHTGSIQSEKRAVLVPSDDIAFTKKTAIAQELFITDMTSKPLLSAGDDARTPFSSKKGTRRRVRGKKKRRGSESAFGEAEGEDDEDDRGKGNFSLTTASLAKGEKPLPDLPRALSSAGLQDFDDKEQLAISDIVIGQSSVGGHADWTRLRITRNCCAERYLGRATGRSQTPPE